MVTNNTLYVTVTCCNEQRRLDSWKQVSLNVLQQFSSNIDDIVILDNSSTHPLYHTTVNGFKHVYRSNKNVGYWSALSWLLNHAEEILERNYKFMHVIEPDRMYFDAGSLSLIENFLDTHAEFGAMKCHLYRVSEWEKFCKPLRYFNIDTTQSIKHDWIQHWNSFKNRVVTTEHVEGKFYRSDFQVQLHNVTRLELMKEAFKVIKDKKPLKEVDFMEAYFNLNSVVGVFDGGIFESSLGLSSKEETMGCSQTSDGKLRENNYIKPEGDFIRDESTFIVTAM